MRYVWFVCLCLTVIIGAYCWSDYHYTFFYSVINYENNKLESQYHINTIVERLKAFYKTHERYPDNDEGLSALTELRKELVFSQPELPPPFGTCTDTNKSNGYYARYPWLISYDAGVLEWNHIPLIYENRRIESPNKFTWSPADKSEFYSAKIDEGVYVYSVNELLSYNTWKYRRFKRYFVPIVSAVLFIIFVILFFKAGRKNEKKQTVMLKVFKWIGSVIFLLISCVIWKNAGETHPRSMCYVPTPSENYGLPSNQDVKDKHDKLLEEYYKRGIITNTTYNKIKQGLKEVDKYNFR